MEHEPKRPDFILRIIRLLAEDGVEIGGQLWPCSRVSAGPGLHTTTYWQESPDGLTDRISLGQLWI